MRTNQPYKEAAYLNTMKKHKTLSRWLFAVIYVAVIAVTVLLDQLTKIFIFDKLLEARPGNGINVLGKFLRFEALYNEGASFGIGKSDAANIVFFLITLLGIPAFCFLLWRSRTRSVVGQVGFAFIVGGTIGNAIDRMFIQTTDGKFFSGKVRDFISFSIFPPIFNIADSFLVIGVLLAILALVFFDPDALVPSFKKERADKAVKQDGDGCEGKDTHDGDGDNKSGDGDGGKSDNGDACCEQCAQTPVDTTENERAVSTCDGAADDGSKTGGEK